MSRAKSKRILALFVCVSLVVVMAFSLGFLVTHTSHTCHGDVCQTCVAIHVSQDIWNTVKAALTAICIFALLAALMEAQRFIPADQAREFATLHTLKVKLNN